MNIEIDLACIDWEEIPTARIVEVCAEARKQAAGFMPTNGLVASVWRGIEGDKHQEALRNIRNQNNRMYLNHTPLEKTEEEKEWLRNFFGELNK